VRGKGSTEVHRVMAMGYLRQWGQGTRDDGNEAHEATLSGDKAHRANNVTTSHRSGRARSPKRGARPSCAMQMRWDICAHWKGASLSMYGVQYTYLNFNFFLSYSIHDTGRSDRHFHTWFENLRPTSTSYTGFPTGAEYKKNIEFTVCAVVQPTGGYFPFFST
jgi:hypothetical protein